MKIYKVKLAVKGLDRTAQYVQNYCGTNGDRDFDCAGDAINYELQYRNEIKQLVFDNAEKEDLELDDSGWEVQLEEIECDENGVEL